MIDFGKAKCTEICLLLVLSLSCGCSVKERRASCPAWLVHDVERSNCPASWPVSLLIRTDGAGVQARETAVPLDVLDDDAVAWVVRQGLVTDCVLGGAESMTLVGDSLLLCPVWAECDSLYGFGWRREVHDIEHDVEVDGVLCKQFARVVLDVKSVPGDDFPYRVVVSGGVCGFALDGNLTPLLGEWRVMPEPMMSGANGHTQKTNDGLFTFLVPRQTDASLEVELWRQKTGGALQTGRKRIDCGTAPPLSEDAVQVTKGGQGTGVTHKKGRICPVELPRLAGPESLRTMELLDRVNIGGAIEKAGYDWGADDLSPDTVYVTVDCVRLTVTVSVAGWADGATFRFDL